MKTLHVIIIVKTYIHVGHYQKMVKKVKKTIDVSDFYSVNIKYLYKLIVKSDKICNLKLKYYFL